jgi:hypothetical protein
MGLSEGGAERLGFAARPGILGFVGEFHLTRNLQLGGQGVSVFPVVIGQFVWPTFEAKKEFNPHGLANAVPHIVGDRPHLGVRRLGMYLLGQTLFSRELIKERFAPRSVRTVALCADSDAVLGPIAEAERFGIEVVVDDLGSAVEN